MKKKYFFVFKWWLRFALVNVVSLQFAFGQIITRLPAAKKYTHTFDDLRIEFDEYSKLINGFDKDAICESSESDQLELDSFNQTTSAESISIDEYDSLLEYFLEEFNYILTQSELGVIEKDELAQSFIDPALKKGMQEKDLVDLLDRVAHLPDFVSKFQEEVDKFEMQVKYEESHVRVGKNTKESWDNILKDMKKNACGHYIYSKQDLSESTEVSEQPVCKVQHVEGDIEKFTAKMMKIETAEGKPARLIENDPELNKRFDTARLLQNELDKYLSDNNFPIELRQNLYVEYTEKVALPFRDLIVVRKSYLKNENSFRGYYDALLSKIPASIMGEYSSDFIKKIEDGTNKYFKSNSIKVIPETYSGKGGNYVTGYRVEYDRTRIFYRDLHTIIKAPTKRNYMLSLKWLTLGLMSSQGLTYQSILDKDDEGFKIPLSCRESNHSDLPEKFWTPDTDGSRAQVLDQIVDGLKILPGHEDIYPSRAKAINQSVIDTYITNTEGNPYQNGYSGVAPLEKYIRAEYALKKAHEQIYGRAELDDENDFESVIQFKVPEIMSLYQEVVNKKSRSASRKNAAGAVNKDEHYKLTYNDYDDVMKILTPVAAQMRYELDEGGSFTPEEENLSIFLAERMQREGLQELQELIEPIKEKFRRKIKVPFPGFYGSTVWKQVALKEMAKHAAALKDLPTNSRLYMLTRDACNETAPDYMGYNSDYASQRRSELCEGEHENYIKNIYEKLKYFLHQEKYLAFKKYEEIDLKRHWEVLGKVWNIWRDAYDRRGGEHEFEFANKTEYDFLLEGMQSKNKWAMARIGYVYYLHELSEMRASFDPERNNRGQRLTENSLCYVSNIDQRLVNLQDFGSVLRIDSPINFFHGNAVLSKKEQKSFFEGIVSEFNSAAHSMGIYTAEVADSKVYKLINEIGYENLFTEEKAQIFAEDKLKMELSNKAKDELQELKDSHQSKITNFFVESMNLGESPEDIDDLIEKNSDRFREFFSVYGDPANYNSKESLILRDHQLKRVLAKDLIRKAVKKKSEDLKNAMNEFCELDLSDHDQVKTMFYAASQNQVHLNKILGIDNKVLEKISAGITDISKEEKQDLWLGMGLMGASFGAILLGSFCTATLGVGCAVVGVSIMTAGLLAAKFQKDLFEREFTRKLNADEYEKYVKSMEKLGFSDTGNSRSVSRSWTWTVIEGIGFIPLFNIVVKSFGSGLKVTAATTRAFYSELRKGGLSKDNAISAWKSAGRAGSTAYREWDISVAHALLGLNKVDDALEGGVDVAKKLAASNEIAAESVDNLKKLRSLHDSGRMSLNELMRQTSKELETLSSAAMKGTSESFAIRRLITNLDTHALDKATAKQVANYWGNNQAAFLKYFKTYWGTWNKKYGSDRLALAQAMAQKAENKEFFWFGKNWLAKMRFGHLAKVSNNMKSIRSQLESLVVNGKVHVNGKTVTSLEDYFLANIDELTTVFQNMPVRKREMPFMFIFQGGPEFSSPRIAKATGMEWFKTGQSLKWAGMHFIGNGIAMRKFFNSRAILRSEIIKNSMNNILGIPQHLASDMFAYSMTQFSKSVDVISESIMRQGLQDSGISNYEDLLKKVNIDKKVLDEVLKLLEVARNKNELAEGLSKLKLSIKQHNKIIAIFQPVFDQRIRLLGEFTQMQVKSATMAQEIIAKDSGFKGKLRGFVRWTLGTTLRSEKPYFALKKLFPSLFGDLPRSHATNSTDSLIKRMNNLSTEDIINILWRPETQEEVALSNMLWTKIRPERVLGELPKDEFFHDAGGVLLKEMHDFKNLENTLIGEIEDEQAFSLLYKYYLNATKINIMQKSPGFIDYI